MMHAHYGHNYGDVPVCNGLGKADLILPHGKGFERYGTWCKECQRILQEIHGTHRFQNLQLEFPWANE